VEFVSYESKDIVMNARASLPAVLLLNDRFDPHWNLLVDGQPATILRCNFLMRGVYLQPGDHKIEFRFRPPVGPLYVSLAAIGVGVLLLGFVLVPMPRNEPQARPQSAAPAPVKQPAKPLQTTETKPAAKANAPKDKRQASKSKR